MVIKVPKERTSGDKWWFYHEQVQDEILLTLHSPADAIIGQYGMEVLISSADGHILQKTDKIGFHLLFNPWCKGKKTNKYTYTYIYIVPFYSSIKINIVFYINHLCVSDDDVHLPDESLLQEYVLNEDGIVYMGEWFDIGRKYWNYGQVLFSNLIFFF